MELFSCKLDYRLHQMLQYFTFTNILNFILPNALQHFWHRVIQLKINSSLSPGIDFFVLFSRWDGVNILDEHCPSIFSLPHQYSSLFAHCNRVNVGCHSIATEFIIKTNEGDLNGQHITHFAFAISCILIFHTTNVQTAQCNVY